MKIRKFITLIVALAVIMSMSVVAFAATTYSNAGTFKMSCGGDWTRVTTLNEYLGNQKETDSTSVTVYTLSKTMSSAPSFRLVNSDNEARSGAFSTPAVGREKTNSSNTGEIGYAYYASLKPAWNQVTNDQSIRIQFKSH